MSARPLVSVPEPGGPGAQFAFADVALYDFDRPEPPVFDIPTSGEEIQMFPVSARVGVAGFGGPPGVYKFTLLLGSDNESGTSATALNYSFVDLAPGATVNMGAYLEHRNPQPGKYTLRVSLSVLAPDKNSLDLVDKSLPYSFRKK